MAYLTLLNAFYDSAISAVTDLLSSSAKPVCCCITWFDVA